LIIWFLLVVVLEVMDMLVAVAVLEDINLELE
jgi:hypothetical protein